MPETGKIYFCWAGRYLLKITFGKNFDPTGNNTADSTKDTSRVHSSCGYSGGSLPIEKNYLFSILHLKKNKSE